MDDFGSWWENVKRQSFQKAKLVVICSIYETFFYQLPASWGKLCFEEYF